MIASALRRFEALKPAYAAKSQAVLTWQAVHRQDSLASQAQQRTIGLYQRSISGEQLLRADTDAKLKISQGKARRRGWLVAIEAAGLALAGYVILTK